MIPLAIPCIGDCGTVQTLQNLYRALSSLLKNEIVKTEMYERLQLLLIKLNHHLSCFVAIHIRKTLFDSVTLYEVLVSASSDVNYGRGNLFSFFSSNPISK